MFDCGALVTGILSRAWASRTLGLLMLALAACLPPQAGAPAPTSAPPTSVAADTPSPTRAPTWVELAPGLERRQETMDLPEQGLRASLILFRLEPERFRFRVLYTPGDPRPVSDWEPDARLVFNAGYFDERDSALGLTLSGGRVFGASYEGFGGMFAVDAQGRASVRSLAAQPYDPLEPLVEAVQCFPMLIYPDGTLFAREDGARARRTALGQDGQGRLVVVIVPQAAFTLAELAGRLRQADLGLTIAMNLDGGGSTGYAAGPNDVVDSLTPIPAVIAVYDR